MNSRALKAVGMIFGGCCLNVVTLEMMVKRDPKVGDIVTFAQFVFVAIAALVSQHHSIGLHSKARGIPLRWHLVYVAIFFLVSVINNKALAFNISMPLHMVFRSGSLVTSMIIGVLLLRKRYSLKQTAGVVAVTIGILLALLQSSKSKQPQQQQQASGGDFIIGIGMLTVAMVLSSVLGVVQEVTYSRFGKQHAIEHMFYSHALSIPLFALLLADGNSSGHQLVSMVRSWDLYMWQCLMANVVTQFICIMGVFNMASATNALTMTLTISIRKFVSLLFSVWYFSNPFTPKHWLATALVFGGTLIYSVNFSATPKQHFDGPLQARDAKQVGDLVPVAAKFSHSPISHYKVGVAAIGSKTKSVYLGTNIEFLESPLCHAVHAEQTACFNAMLHGEGSIDAIFLSANPCGHCRQFMIELPYGRDIQVSVVGKTTQQLVSLIPEPFTPADLPPYTVPTLQCTCTACEKQIPETLAKICHSNPWNGAGAAPHCACKCQKCRSVDWLSRVAIEAAVRTVSVSSSLMSGCAVEFSNGQIYAGHYVENAAYNPSLQPLAAALSTTVFVESPTKVDWSTITRVVLAEFGDSKLTNEFPTQDLLSQLSPKAKLTVIKF